MLIKVALKHMSYLLDQQTKMFTIMEQVLGCMQFMVLYDPDMVKWLIVWLIKCRQTVTNGEVAKYAVSSVHIDYDRANQLIPVGQDETREAGVSNWLST